MAQPHQCWGCGKAEQAAGYRFQMCTLCREEGLVSVFCDAACLHAAWPRHKEWHREQRRLRALAESVAAKHWRIAASAPSPYDELLAAAGTMQIGVAGTTAPAPSPPPQMSDVVTAARQYLQTVERSSASSLGWAENAVAAYALLSQDEIVRTVPRPAWWNDDSLKALSEQILAARPDYALAWRMRGEVLCARLGACSWTIAAPRNSTELHEAGRCFQRAAALGVDEAPADRETVVRQALACFRAAQTSQS